MSRTCGSSRATTSRLQAAHLGVVAEAGGDHRGREVGRGPTPGSRGRRAAPARRARRTTARRASGRRRRRRSCPRASSQAMLTAHCGIPNRKLIVPSSGSTTQRSPLRPLARRRPPRRGCRRRAARRRGARGSAARRRGRPRRPGRSGSTWRSRSRSGPANASRSWRPASRATASAISRSTRGHSAGRRSAQPIARLELRGQRRAAPARRRGGATSWTASGNPSGVKPGRDRRRRLPGVVVGRRSTGRSGSSR